MVAWQPHDANNTTACFHVFTRDVTFHGFDFLSDVIRYSKSAWLQIAEPQNMDTSELYIWWIVSASSDTWRSLSLFRKIKIPASEHDSSYGNATDQMRSSDISADTVAGSSWWFQHITSSCGRGWRRRKTGWFITAGGKHLLPNTHTHTHTRFCFGHLLTHKCFPLASHTHRYTPNITAVMYVLKTRLSS